MLRALILSVLLALSAAPAFAQDSAAIETRAHALGAKLRCVVCQSESINDSQADMARDMRLLIRDRLRQGWSDEQLIDYIRSRYGDYILLQPPVQSNTYVLWAFPFLAFLAAGALVLSRFRRKSPQA